MTERQTSGFANWQLQAVGGVPASALVRIATSAMNRSVGRVQLQRCSHLPHSALWLVFSCCLSASRCSFCFVSDTCSNKKKTTFDTFVENFSILGDGVWEISLAAACRNIFVLGAGRWGWLRLETTGMNPGPPCRGKSPIMDRFCFTAVKLLE
jgi:hypothetical protein